MLEAVITLRREQRKRAIHINTLRAQGISVPTPVTLSSADGPQVRKTAKFQKKTLGPRWSVWVGKAVAKLVSTG